MAFPLPPGVAEYNARDASKDINSHWCYPDLKDHSWTREVVYDTFAKRRPKSGEGRKDLVGILRSRIDPDIKILSEPRLRVHHHGVTADYQVSNFQAFEKTQ